MPDTRSAVRQNTDLAWVDTLECLGTFTLSFTPLLE